MTMTCTCDAIEARTAEGPCPAHPVEVGCEVRFVRGGREIDWLGLLKPYQMIFSPGYGAGDEPHDKPYRTVAQVEGAWFSVEAHPDVWAPVSAVRVIVNRAGSQVSGRADGHPDSSLVGAAAPLCPRCGQPASGTLDGEPACTSRACDGRGTAIRYLRPREASTTDDQAALRARIQERRDERWKQVATLSHAPRASAIILDRATTNVSRLDRAPCVHEVRGERTCRCRTVAEGGPRVEVES